MLGERSPQDKSTNAFLGLLFVDHKRSAYRVETTQEEESLGRGKIMTRKAADGWYDHIHVVEVVSFQSANPIVRQVLQAELVRVSQILQHLKRLGAMPRQIAQIRADGILVTGGEGL